MRRDYSIRIFFLSFMLLAGTLAAQSKIATTGNAAMAASYSFQAPDDDDEGEGDIPELPVVALVNDTTECTSLTEAIWMAPTDSTLTRIKLIEDVSSTTVIVKEGKNIALDLNGHEVTLDEGGIYNYGELAIIDESGNGIVKMDSVNQSIVYNYGKLTISGGQYANNTEAPKDETDRRRCVLTFEDSETIINDGTFTSGYQTLYIGGDATIDGGTFLAGGNTDVIANYGTKGQLVINGGAITNNADKPEGTDFRRCLLTNPKSTTVIKGGVFTSGGAVLYLRGNTTIDNGLFETTGNAFVVGNYDAEVTINGGTFTNNADDAESTDSRRCLYTSKETKTVINGGTFTTAGQTLCFNGEGIITDGTFTSTGNTVVCGNYNTNGNLEISGGTFVNDGKEAEEEGEEEGGEETTTQDNRRCVWGSKNTNTLISGGSFTNESSAQTLCFYGEATISGGTIENKGKGSGCASNGKVTVTDCRISARNVFICWEDATLTCSGGLYSNPVREELLVEGYVCVANTDNATKSKYPYKVMNEDDVVEVEGDVNGDGTVDVADISSVINVMAGGSNDEQVVAKADVNGDGAVDVADISSIINIMASN